MAWEPVSAIAIAELFGVSRKTVYDWVLQGCPKTQRKFAPPEVVQWYLLARGDSNSKQLEEARRRLVDAQREKTELENAKLRGELLDYEETKTAVMAIGAMLASRLDSLGPRIAHDLVDLSDPADIQAAIFSECRELRREMARGLQAVVGDRDLGLDDRPAPEPQRRRVGRRQPRAAAGKPRAGAVA